MAEINRELFFEKVRKTTENECHTWLASHFANGYGQFKIQRQPFYAHRVAYELANGPFPLHLHVRHTCDNRGCVNPKHLVLGTHADNMQDVRNRGNGLRKLSLQDRIEIIDLWKSGLFTQISLGRLYGVSNVAVARHVHRG